MTSRILEAARLKGGASPRSRACNRGVAWFHRLADENVDRRVAPRRAQRLNWGKALDAADRFLCDCLIADRTQAGARLRLARNVVPPPAFQLFEEASGAIYAARIVWRRGSEIGCRLSRAPTPGKAQAARRMRSRNYAL